MTKTIRIIESCGAFAENKDEARSIREATLRPSLEDATTRIVLDFEDVDSSTQSFLHALLSDLLQTHGAKLLNRIEFKNCSKSIKSLIGAVVNYSLE